MFVVFDEVKRGNFVRVAASEENVRHLNGVRLDISKIEGRKRINNGFILIALWLFYLTFSSQKWSIFIYFSGVIVESGDRIELNNVPVVTPTGDVVVDNLSIKVRKKVLSFLFKVKFLHHS